MRIIRQLTIPSILIMVLTLNSAHAQEFYEIWHTTGATDSSDLGVYMVAAGDQNLDGYDDILVSARGEGMVYLYFGGNPMDTIPDMEFTEPHDHDFCMLPQQCEDLNGDSFPDFCISSDCELSGAPVWFPKTYVYFGGPLLDNEADLILEPDNLNPNCGFGESVSMGDINGDGWNDLVVGAASYYIPSVFVDEGKIYCFYGGPDLDDVCDYSITSSPNNIIHFGQHISCSGDVDNDGYNDILSKGMFPDIQAMNGRMMFNGGSPPDSNVAWHYFVYQSSNYLNGATYFLPDLNGDGYDEILLSGHTPAYASGYIFWGGAEIDTLPNVEFVSDGGWYSGTGIAGDVDNDGDMDYLTGDWGAGIISLFLLRPDMSGNEWWDWSIQMPGIGNRMCYAGDVNGDGIDDFMFNKWFWPESNGEVYIYSDTTLAGVSGPETELSFPAFRMYPNYPNPFNAQTVIPFTINREREVKIDIFDITGRSVGAKGISPLQARYSAGMHEIIWNAEGFSSGVYLVRLQQQSAGTLLHRERKVVLVK